MTKNSADSSFPSAYNSWHRAFCVVLSALLVITLIPASAVATPPSTAVPSQEASGPPLGSDEATYGAPADAIPDPAAEVKPQVVMCRLHIGIIIAVV